MKHLLTVIFLLAVFNASGQAELPKNQAMCYQVTRWYNAGKYDSIWYTFSPDMKAALPQPNSLMFFRSVAMQLGKITGTQFSGYQQTFAIYLATFEKGTRGIFLSVDDSMRINGLIIKPYQPASLPNIARNITRLRLPFDGEWYVVWGGDTKEQNYHVESVAQKNAFDMLKVDGQGQTHKGTGARNDDYYAFGQPIFAPCAGTVVFARDSVPDNKSGEMNTEFITGNSVILKTANNEYIVFAHFRQHSVLVKEGQTVVVGQQLAQCGNSGHSSEPHLHFHIQNVQDMDIATGVKCYFDSIRVNGTLVVNHSPVRGEKVANIR